MSDKRWWHSGNDEYHRLLHCRKWRELRKRKLTEAVWCEDCREQGRRELATEVHHIRPAITGTTPSEMARLVYDYGNLRALCHACHVARHQHRPTPKEGVKEEVKRTVESFALRFFGE